MGHLGDIADQEGCILCIPIDNNLLIASSELAEQLRDSCGQDLEVELTEVSKLIDEQGIAPESLDGWIIPLSSYNLRQFKGQLTVVLILSHFYIFSHFSDGECLGGENYETDTW